MKKTIQGVPPPPPPQCSRSGASVATADGCVSETASPPLLVPLLSYPEMMSVNIDAMGLESGFNETVICPYMKGMYGGANLSTENTAALAKTIGEHLFIRNKEPLPGNGDDEPSAPADSCSAMSDDGDAKNLARSVFDAVSFFPDVDVTAPLVFDTDADGVPPPALENAADNITVPAPAPLIMAHVSDVPVKRRCKRPPKPKELVAQDSVGASVTTRIVPTDAAAMTVMVWRGRPSKPKNPEDSSVAPTVTPVVTVGANDSPVNCGRGRSTKLKELITEAPIGVPAEVAGVSVKRGRGCSPKSGMLCLLGHLPKKAKVAEEASISAPSDARVELPVKRGHGRSLKSGMLSPLGRPPKKTKVTEEPPISVPGAAAGVAADARVIPPVKRGRGRSPKSAMLSPRGRQPKKAKVSEETPSNGTLAAGPVCVKHGRGRPPMEHNSSVGLRKFSELGVWATNNGITRRNIVKRLPLPIQPYYHNRALIPKNPERQVDGSCVVVAVKYALEMRYCVKTGVKYHEDFIDLISLKRMLAEAGLYSINGSSAKQILDYLICNGVPMKNKKRLRVVEYSEAFAWKTSPVDIAEELFRNGPVVGILNCDEEFLASPGPYKGCLVPLDGEPHGLVCHGYQFKKGALHLNILDNIEGTTYGPHGKVHIDAFDSFVIPRIDTD